MEKMKRNFAKVLMLFGVLGILGGCAGSEGISEAVADNSEAVSEQLQAAETKEVLKKDNYEASFISTEEASGETETAAEEPQVSELTIHFIDVGQGDATLIECDDAYMLIDAGNNDKGTLVQNYLVKQGVETLDYVIGTHPDADHIGGLDVAIYKFDCETIILPDAEKDTKTYEDVLLAIQSKAYKITAPVVGDTYTLGSAEFTIISPNRNYGSNVNDNSVGILLQNGENKFLFVGDAEEDAEEDMVNSGMNLMADVYKVSHHGSKTATTDAFFAAVSPTYAVISAGEDNAYGHPAAEVLNKLREAGVEVFRTDEQGTIVLTSDGKTITWNCSPSESWQAGEAKGSAAVPEQTNTDEAAAGGMAAVPEQSNTDKTAAEGTAAVPEQTNTDETAAEGTAAVQEQTDTNTTISETPAESTAIIVHITKSGSKYHTAGCQYLHSSDIEIELDKAKASGYTPCSKCNPPQ